MEPRLKFNEYAFSRLKALLRSASVHAPQTRRSSVEMRSPHKFDECNDYLTSAANDAYDLS